MEYSTCCLSKSRYVRDYGNHHDECTKCGCECDVISEEEKDKLLLIKENKNNG